MNFTVPVEQDYMDDCNQKIKIANLQFDTLKINIYHLRSLKQLILKVYNQTNGDPAKSCYIVHIQYNREMLCVDLKYNKQ